MVPENAAFQTQHHALTEAWLAYMQRAFVVMVYTVVTGVLGHREIDIGLVP